MTIERLPPQNLDAERACLGSMLLSAKAAQDSFEFVLPADFYDPRHEVIAEAIVGQMGRNRPHDSIAVVEALRSAGELQRAGDAEYLIELTGFPTTTSNAAYWAEIVHDKAVLRRLVAAGVRIEQMGFASEGSVDDLIEAARSEVDAASGMQSKAVRMVGDIVPDVVARLREKATFVPTPWPRLNRAIGGLRPGAVYVIAARPGVGKTVVAAQLAAKLAEHGRVAFSSLEMSEDELVSRLISERLGIEVGHLKDNRMTARDWEILQDGRAQLEGLNVAIDDRASVSGVDVRSFARAVSRGGKLAGVVVDYMQLMSSRSKLDRHLQVAEFSRQMKVMAKDFHVPVIALSQLNRKSEDRSDQVPRLSDLRESGAIEQDADVVILLRREHTGAGEMLVMDVAKNRHGETGEAQLVWDGARSRVLDD